MLFQFKIWKIVYLAISFSDVYFAVRGRFIQLKTTKQSILFKTSLLKSHFSLCKLPLDFATAAINYVSLRLWSLLTLSWWSPLSYRNKSMDWFLCDNGLRHKRVKGLFQHSGICMVLICIRLWPTITWDRIHSLNIRKRGAYKNFKIFYIESYPWYTLQLLQSI